MATGRRRGHRRVVRPATRPDAAPKGDAPPAASEVAADDTDTGWSAAGDLKDAEADGHESWLRQQRPPHWE